MGRRSLKRCGEKYKIGAVMRSYADHCAALVEKNAAANRS